MAAEPLSNTALRRFAEAERKMRSKWQTIGEFRLAGEKVLNHSRCDKMCRSEVVEEKSALRFLK